jgi:hypothetical protein
MKGQCLQKDVHGVDRAVGLRWLWHEDEVEEKLDMLPSSRQSGLASEYVDLEVQ